MGEIKDSFEYQGKTFKCQGYTYELLSDEEFNSIVNLWNTLPSKDEIYHQINQFAKGNNNISKIVKHYFRPIMDEVKKYFDKWTIADVFKCKDMLSMFMARIKKNEKVFNSDSIIENLDTAFRLGGKGIASKVSNFPVDVCDETLRKYNVNNVYYDPSCGWGVRQMCAMRLGIDYYGTDPNFKLVEKLNEFNQDYKKVTGYSGVTKIFCQGSENFIEELENKVGLIFTSPPYFNLEDYKFGDQSWKQGDSFESWVNNYLEPTFKNCYKYLINNGYMIINIKDFNGVELEKATRETAEKCGFKLYNVEGLEQGKRLNSTNSSRGDLIVDSSENVYVFVKDCFEKPTETNLFGDSIEIETNEAIKVGTTTEYTKKEKKEKAIIIKEENEELW